MGKKRITAMVYFKEKLRNFPSAFITGFFLLASEIFADSSRDQSNMK